MVSYLSNSAERSSSGKPGSGSNEMVKMERAMGTPRKDGGVSKADKAVQDPGLKDYRLGECLGKGAFGAVYKAFNWGTGEAVAVKQIKLGNLPRSELRMIEAEIDMLKTLKHDNIVKYLGFVKSLDCWNIILEYCENGSLHSICKNYGKFPENLVGVYMAQILQGVQYLHDQGIIHRDIKGANILTTKDGKVKLADFGVSTSTLTGADKEAQVVGTPYWMAPEIIQLSGATPASDIWSLGCTVIELLDGHPPYHKLAPMPALFAIVNDDHPPLPEGVSPAVLDFLMQCFQKDPNLRVSARKLLNHAWIVGSRRTDAPVAKPSADFGEAVEELKQWNEALKSPNSAASFRSSTGSSTGSPMTTKRDPPLRNISNAQQSSPNRNVPTNGQANNPKPRLPNDVFQLPEDTGDDDNWDADFASSISPSALHLPQFKPHDNFGGMLSSDRLKAFASLDAAADDSKTWDKDFEESDFMTIRGPPRKFFDIEEQEIQTIRPIKTNPAPLITQGLPSASAPKGHARNSSINTTLRPKSPIKAHAETKILPAPHPATLYREQSVEDYSDLFVDDDSVFNRRLDIVKGDALSPRLFQPSDLTRPAQISHTNGNSHKIRAPIKDDDGPVIRRTDSSVEIQQYAESADDEDFSDIFGDDGMTSDRDEGERASEDGGLTLNSKLSTNSWLGDEDEEEDPFASVEEGFGEFDFQANIARNKRARLRTSVENLLGSLKTTEPEDTLCSTSEQLLNILYDSEEAKEMIISAHGMLPILEVLDGRTVKSQQDIILQLLKVVNTTILDKVELQEHLCFIGGIPIITKFAAKQYSLDIRLEAAAFVRQMYQTSTLTLQMFVSAGGLNVLVEFLDEDYDEARDLALIGVSGVWNVFELQGPTPKNDFCRIFSRSNILSPLALILDRVLDEDDELSELIAGRIVNIFYLFSQAESYVKEVVADFVVLKRVLKDLRRMIPAHQIMMLKFVKNLSMLSTTLDALHSANAIEVLIDLLNSIMRKAPAHFREIANQVLNTLFNLCRLSKVRQEDAAMNGIIPLLMRIMKTERPPKEFALPILCDMAHSGKVGRKYLWQNKGLQFYVSLLHDQYWQVTALDAIFIWLQEETAKVEKILLEGKFTQAIIKCFTSPRASNFDYNILEPLQKLLRLSAPISRSLARSDLFLAVSDKLNHRKPVVRLNLLRILRSICEASKGVESVKGHKLFETIKRLAEEDSAVLVKTMAGELIKCKLQIDEESKHDVSRSSMSRRMSSYSPPELRHATSVPSTPTRSSRTSQLPPLSDGSTTPRRQAVVSMSNNESLVFLPRDRDRSRDGSTGPIMMRRTSAEAGSRSRLPRTTIHRASRSSLAVPTGGASGQTFTAIENGTRTRDESRSAAAAAVAGNGRLAGSPAAVPSSRRRTRLPSDGDSRLS